MKPISRAIVVLAMLSARAASAQNAAGTWQHGRRAVEGRSGAVLPPAAPVRRRLPAPAAAPTAPAPVAKPPAPVPVLTPAAASAMTAEPVKPATSSAGGAGLSPSLPQVAGGTNMSSKQAEELNPSTGGAADEWKFQFHGYFRAPLRASFGPPTPADQPSIYNTTIRG